MDIHKNYIAEQMERVIKTPYHMMPTIFGQAVENACDYLTRKMIDKDAKESVEGSYKKTIDESQE